MGLAASQARFLGLTARKSNVEYEGQQVNQQRTALANESASLYSQLTNLKVPTPPDIINYYTTEYSFKYNDVTYTMSALPVRNSNGTYSVGLTYDATVANFKELDSMTGIDFSNAQISTLAQYPDLKKFLGDKYDDNEQIKMMTSNKNYYYQIGADSDAKTYQYFANQVTYNMVSNNASLKYNQAGEYESITIPELSEEPISVSTTTRQDSTAYDLAMNDYQKEYNEYEKTIAAINAKTETIQQQDKTLELRLKQLDTEQEAVQTEMDAVSKVINKNVESTFKTFA